MVRANPALRLSPLPVMAVASLSLAACQGSGTDRPVTSWERPESVGSETIIAGEQPSADMRGLPSTETESGAQSSGDSTVVTSGAPSGTATTADTNGVASDVGMAFAPADSSGRSGVDTLFSAPPPHPN